MTLSKRRLSAVSVHIAYKRASTCSKYKSQNTSAVAVLYIDYTYYIDFDYLGGGSVYYNIHAIKHKVIILILSNKIIFPERVKEGFQSL